MTTHIMLDLETLGTTPGSVILSIGAVKFNRHGITGTDFYNTIDPADSVRHGLKMDVSTIMWWMQQSEDARKALTEASGTLTYTLLMFREWLREGDPLAVAIWGNGANFDNVVLAAAYDACGIERPWKHSQDRCYRTVKCMHPDLPLAKRTGTHHNALDDARSQAEHLITLPSFQAMCDREEALASA